LRLEILHIVVGVAITPGFAEPDSIDDAGVVQRVADYRVIRSQ
jgi:hypothetical protein